jgi:hypothetical protein
MSGVGASARVLGVPPGDFFKPDAIEQASGPDPTAWTMELNVRPFTEKLIARYF